jgi:N6-adenosine-specific RNA methylase IME4
MMDFSNLKAHPFADMFPMIGKEDYPAFKLDIEISGLADQVILLDGLILDGRNRYRVLKELGREANPENYINFADLGLAMTPFDYVISKNMQRRHLNESQRAMIAARAATMRQGERTDLSPDAPLNADAPLDVTAPSAHMPKVSQGDAAAMFKVSERMVTGANKIIKNGVDELKELVDAGEVPVTVAEQIASLPKPEQERVMIGNPPEKLKAALKRHEREKREAELGDKQQALPIEKFGVIYADPEWEFATRSEAGKDRSAENHYPCSPYEAIMARRVQDIAADDCVLFMWATVPCLIEAVCVLHAWGFVALAFDDVTGHLVIDKKKARYVSQWSWIKTRIANGYWGRNKHELLLIATRGRPVAPALGTQPESATVFEYAEPPSLDTAALIEEAAQEHSRKPDIFAEWIEKLFPNTPKIELNARRKRPGWSVWGNEAPADEEAEDEAPDASTVADDDEWEAADPAKAGGVASAFAAEVAAMVKEAEGGVEYAAPSSPSAAGDRMPPMVAYEGKHTEGTDSLIKWGYANKKPIALICAWLGLPEKQKGIVKGRANRLGLTDPARIIENNKARAKGGDNA